MEKEVGIKIGLQYNSWTTKLETLPQIWKLIRSNHNAKINKEYDMQLAKCFWKKDSR